jgi:hypothetical protein
MFQLNDRRFGYNPDVMAVISASLGQIVGWSPVRADSSSLGMVDLFEIYHS